MNDAHRHYALTLWLAQRPCFCCGCWWLAPADARRVKRVIRIVKKETRAWQRQRVRKAEVAGQVRPS